jgi:hypothetical protein
MFHDKCQQICRSPGECTRVKNGDLIIVWKLYTMLMVSRMISADPNLPSSSGAVEWGGGTQFGRYLWHQQSHLCLIWLFCTWISGQLSKRWMANEYWLVSMWGAANYEHQWYTGDSSYLWYQLPVLPPSPSAYWGKLTSPYASTHLSSVCPYGWQQLGKKCFISVHQPFPLDM